jgi:hypothetical protein
MTAPNSQDVPLIYHIFADRGVESEVLDDYGRVVRVGLNAVGNDASEAVRADATELPLRRGADLAVLHPPCTRWANMTSISGDPDDHPNLIPEAREIGREYATDYIIENVPRAPLRDAVVLDGRMFGLPIRYERAFETTFSVEQPSRYASLSGDAETSPYFYSDRSREWWAAAKGYPDAYPKQHMAKNSVPAPFIRHLLRCWMVESRDAVGGADYSSHDELDVEQRAAENHALNAGWSK